MAALNPAFMSATVRQPVLFMGHGSPMNAIEDNQYARTWLEIGRSLPRPEAVLCISAHWQTDGTLVTAMPRPRTIHDFYGFPRALYEKQYPAPGSLELAGLVRETIGMDLVGKDMSWGLDHGTWSVLARLLPAADVPVVQLSLDAAKSPAEHYALAARLAVLRRRGVLIVGSGNAVHNLGNLCWEDRAYPWAVDFDTLVKEAIIRRDYAALVDYQRHGDMARLAIPTNEHFLPLLYVLALQEPGEEPVWYCEQVTNCSISMRCLRFG
ncbi:MAG: 4,5-DOPA-extradiol-dioxygenase [Anaerolineae bacterium]